MGLYNQSLNENIDNVQLKETIGKGGSGGGSDLHVYSEEEHIVGTWIDGRPVYESIYTFSAANDFQWHWFMDLGLGDIYLISFEPLPEISGVTTDDTKYSRMYNVGPWTFGVKVGTSFSPIVDGKVIIRYVKRT